jgi:hypothetical protein
MIPVPAAELAMANSFLTMSALEFLAAVSANSDLLQLLQVLGLSNPGYSVGPDGVTFNLE